MKAVLFNIDVRFIPCGEIEGIVTGVIAGVLAKLGVMLRLAVLAVRFAFDMVKGIIGRALELRVRFAFDIVGVTIGLMLELATGVV